MQKWKTKEPRVKMPFKANKYLKSKRFRNIKCTLIAETIRERATIVFEMVKIKT